MESYWRAWVGIRVKVLTWWRDSRLISSPLVPEVDLLPPELRHRWCPSPKVRRPSAERPRKTEGSGGGRRRTGLSSPSGETESQSLSLPPEDGGDPVRVGVIRVTEETETPF